MSVIWARCSKVLRSSFTGKNQRSFDFAQDDKEMRKGKWRARIFPAYFTAASFFTSIRFNHSWRSFDSWFWVSIVRT